MVWTAHLIDSVKDQLRSFSYQLARFATRSLQSKDNITVMILLLMKDTESILKERLAAETSGTSYYKTDNITSSTSNGNKELSLESPFIEVKGNDDNNSADLEYILLREAKVEEEGIITKEAEEKDLKVASEDNSCVERR